jgi:hypothetical protein
MKPTKRTMNEAPSRDPDSMVKVWSSVMAPWEWKARAVAAMGDPESTR